jgi:hypothetical protein
VNPAVARLIHDELEAYGTDGGNGLDDADLRESLLALRAVTRRLGVEEHEVPFRDFTSFRNWPQRASANAGSPRARCC